MADKGISVLEFDAVDAVGMEEGRLGGALLNMAPGDLVCIAAVADDRRLIADLAGGLDEASAGEVRFGGEAWVRMPVADQTQRRQTIGWILPETGAWLSNLDLDENVTLSARVRGELSPEKIAEAATALAREFELEALPKIRPAWATARDRRISQWVRALLGTPRLLIVDSGTDTLASAAVQPLIRMLSQRREQGLAVLWLADRNPPADFVGPLSGRRYKVVEGRFEPET